MERKVVFVASDGKEFGIMVDCRQHELGLPAQRRVSEFIEATRPELTSKRKLSEYRSLLLEYEEWRVDTGHVSGAEPDAYEEETSSA